MSDIAGRILTESRGRRSPAACDFGEPVISNVLHPEYGCNIFQKVNRWYYFCHLCPIWEIYLHFLSNSLNRK